MATCTRYVEGCLHIHKPHLRKRAAQLQDHSIIPLFGSELCTSERSQLVSLGSLPSLEIIVIGEPRYCEDSWTPGESPIRHRSFRMYRVMVEVIGHYQTASIDLPKLPLSTIRFRTAGGLFQDLSFRTDVKAQDDSASRCNHVLTYDRT